MQFSISSKQRAIHNFFPPQDYSLFFKNNEYFYTQKSFIPIAEKSNNNGMLNIRELNDEKMDIALNHLFEFLLREDFSDISKKIEKSYHERIHQLVSVFDENLEKDANFLDSVLDQKPSDLLDNSDFLISTDLDPKSFNDFCLGLFLNTLSVFTEEVIDDLYMEDKFDHKGNIKKLEFWLKTKNGLIYLSDLLSISFLETGMIASFSEIV